MKLYEIIKSYKSELSADEAWKKIETHCKDALKDLETPIVRGMKNFESGFGIIQGEASQRASANTSNHYTEILDAALAKDGFPKRSASIICANAENWEHADTYGVLHAIIPYDGVKIGVCPYGDMWETEISIGDWSKPIARWNSAFNGLKISDKSYEDLKRDLKKWITDPPRKILNDEKWIYEFNPSTLDKQLKESFSEPFKLTTTAKSGVYNDGECREVWIGGKCVAIDIEIYQKLLKSKGRELRMPV